MRRIGTAVFVATALSGFVLAEQDAAPRIGKITLKMDGGVCKKTLTDGDRDIDVSRTPSLAWEVKNEDCQEEQKVIVGRAKQSGRHFSVLDCRNGKVTVRRGKMKPLECRVNPECAGPNNAKKVYDYAVCVNGRIATDPELRVGGRTPFLGDCKEDPRPESKCEDATR